VPWKAADPAAPFHREHQRVYGYSNPERAIEVVTIRVRARVEVPKPGPLSRRPRAHTSVELRRIHSAGAWRDTPVHLRSSLTAKTLLGPALVLDYGSTTLIPPGWSFSVDKAGSLKITRRRKR
jgi:N-methylhydantoinase A